MLNWSSFNESKSVVIYKKKPDYPSSNHELNLELLQDYFLSIEDLGYKLLFELAVYQNNEWMSISYCNNETVNGVGFYVHVEDIFNDSKWEMPDLESFSKLISEITGICKRITINYKCELSASIDDWSINIFFIKSGTLYDACYISYKFLMDYASEIFSTINFLLNSKELDESDIYFIKKIDFIERNKNYFIELIIKDEYIKNSISANTFKSMFEENMDDIYDTHYKFDSISKEGNKYIIKNFISSDIKFQY